MSLQVCQNTYLIFRDTNERESELQAKILALKGWVEDGEKEIASLWKEVGTLREGAA